MGWFRTLMTWRDAPTPDDAPKRSREERWSAPLTFQLNGAESLFAEMAGTSNAALSRRVDRAEAMSVPAVKRSRDLICGTLGTLPIRTLNAARETVRTPLLEQPEPDVARSVTMTRTVEDMLFEGWAWWRITDFGADGFPTKIRRLDARTVDVRANGRVYVSRDGRAQGQATEHVPDELLIRIDSPNDALLVAGARAIRAALLLDQTAARYANDPLPLGYFAPREGVDVGDPEEIADLLDEWDEARRTRSWGYVGAALEAKSLQWAPEQLQLSAARDYAVLEISRTVGVDPEDLGVSTTSRTYANAEQRRLDLIDFTLAAYVAAIEGRLSMNDVTRRGHRVRFDYDGFLRSDTKTRMETYALGRQVGVYTDERIAEIENVPSATQPGIAPERVAPVTPLRPVPDEETTVENQARAAGVRFTADAIPEVTGTRVSFDTAEIAETFRVNPEKRTISGLAVPWGAVARSGFANWRFEKGSLHWADEGRVKMLRDHDTTQPVGRAVRLQTTPAGLDVSFKIARGAEGDRVLELAEDGVLDGLSVGIDFAEGDDWQRDPTDESVRLVRKATLREVTITAMPAFDGARVSSVAASRESEITMSAPAVEPTAPAAPAAAPDLTQFTTGVSDALKAAVAEAFAKIEFPQPREVVPAGRAVVTREAPVYAMNGHGPSLVRDAWKARTEDNHEARERLRKFEAQTQDAAEQAMTSLQFATGTTGNLGEVIPPGYRPELFVTQMIQGRPLASSVSRGTIADATPFTVPRFVSATNMSSNHVEGTNPTDGTLDLESVTVTPGATSGLFQLSREILDSANPAIDAIAMMAMQESYSQQTEAKVYAELNGTNGQGGAITAGFVPSGAQAATTSGGAGALKGGPELLAGIRSALALYPFRRFAAPDRAHLSQEATSALAEAVGSDGRPLLPSVGAQNTAGLGNAVTQGWFIDGLAFAPTWSMTGNAAGDADVLMYNSNDIWAWESPLLTFRFEERGGPARIDLALFGYFATRLLRPVGLSAIRHTDAA